jgi:RNA polymerase sigma factor (sigma-70 family)
MLYTLSLSFDLIFRRHQQELLRFAGQYSNEEVAEDLVQEAYLRLIRQAQTETIENPRAYLYKITRNLSADYLRQGLIRSRHQDDSQVELEQIPNQHPGIDAELEAVDRLQRCLKALDGLPEIVRHVFLLHRIDGMTYAEIGNALGIPPRTVERYAAKALAHCFAKDRDSF